MTWLTIYLLLTLLFISREILAKSSSLEHWKVNLEARLKQYSAQYDQLNKVIQASINYRPSISDIGRKKLTITTKPRLNFGEIIIKGNNNGILIDSLRGKNSLDQMYHSTTYFIENIRAQVTELKRIVEDVTSKIRNSSHRYIFKNRPSRIASVKRFLNPTLVASVSYVTNVQVEHINNNAIVSDIIKRIFGPNQWTDNFKYDRSGRLYYEGVKFIHEQVIFQQNLSSACCHQLYPFGNINNLMRKSINQTVNNPVIIFRSKLHINSMNVDQLENVYNSTAIQDTNTGPYQQSRFILKPDNILFIKHNIQREHSQHPINLIIRNSPVVIRNAHSINNFILINAKQLYITKGSHYLVDGLKDQRVRATTATFGQVNFYNRLDSQLVNSIYKFSEFVRNSLVRTDRAAILPNLSLSLVQSEGSPQSAMTIHNALQIDKLNGLSIPQDIIMASQLSNYNRYLLVRGRKVFLSTSHFKSIVIGGKTSNLILPGEVLTIYQNDQHGNHKQPDKLKSEIFFPHGIHLSQGMEFVSELINFDVLGPMRQNVTTSEAFLSRLIHRGVNAIGTISCPLALGRLDFTNNFNQINGISIQDIQSLWLPSNTFHSGTIWFKGLVEVDHCHISGMNNVKDWMQNLIFVGDTHLAQSIYTSIVFNNIQAPKRINVNHLIVHRRGTNQQVLGGDSLQLLDRVLLDAHNSVPSNTRLRSLKVLNRLELTNPSYSTINGIRLSDLVTVDSGGPINGRVTMVRGIQVKSVIFANRVQSNYIIGQTDLLSFYSSRIPIFPRWENIVIGERSNRRAIVLNNVVLDSGNLVDELFTNNINYQLFEKFIARIMSLSKNQTITSRLRFHNDTVFESEIFTNQQQRGLVNNFIFSTFKISNITFADGLSVKEIIAIPESRIICDRQSVAVAAQTEHNTNNSSRQSVIKGTVLFPDLMEESLMKRGSFFMKGQLTTFDKLIVLGNVHVKLVNGLKLAQRYLLNSTVRLPPYEQKKQIIKNKIIFDNNVNITGDLDLWLTE